MTGFNLIPKQAEKKVGLIREMRGFTLIEIMVVVIIIGTIAGLVGVRVFDRLREAKEEAAFTQMQSIIQALQFYKLRNNTYPASLQMLVGPGGGGVGGYLDSDSVPLDPWNQEYIYMTNGTDFAIRSMGANERDDGGGGDDIDGRAS